MPIVGLLPPPPILVTPLYVVPPIDAVPEFNALTTTVPTLLAKLFNNKLIPVPDGCEHVIASWPPELKKYRAASPLANVAVCVNVAILDHVLATVTVFDVVPLCEDALYLFV